MIITHYLTFLFLRNFATWATVEIEKLFHQEALVKVAAQN